MNNPRPDSNGCIFDSYNGVVVIDKPKGITSFKAVEKLRKALRIKKAGHTGTLDPLATGVLPVCLGEATKLSSFIMGQDKAYYVRAKLGERTDTLDSDGKITDTKALPKLLTKEKVNSILESFIGEIEQIPPMYSAIKKDGVPLYKIARQGGTRDRESRKVRINSIQLMELLLPHFELLVTCSKGTYIRTLIDDIGEKLGSYAHVVELRRVINGVFDIKDSIDISGEISPKDISKKIISLESVVGMIMPLIEVDSSRANCIAKGMNDCLDGVEGVPDITAPGSYGIICVSKDSKKLVAIASENKTIRVFNYFLWV